MRTLTARFSSNQDLVYSNPVEIRWNDGRPASFETYEHHRADTRTLVQTGDGMEVRLFPDVVGDVRYDGYYRLWFVVPQGGEPISLDVRRPDATDLDLRAALFHLPVAFRALIRR